MALQLGALRDALIDAGASDTKASQAAEELASYEDRLHGIDQRMNALERSMTALEARMTAIEARMGALDVRMNMLTWMVGLNMALTAGVLWRLTTH